MMKFAFGAILAFGTTIAFAEPASAYIECNGGDCWHSDRRVVTRGVRIEHHPDDWYFHQHWDTDRHWHDYRNGRGYWRNGVWINL